MAKSCKELSRAKEEVKSLRIMKEDLERRIELVEFELKKEKESSIVLEGQVKELIETKKEMDKLQEGHVEQLRFKDEVSIGLRNALAENESKYNCDKEKLESELELRDTELREVKNKLVSQSVKFGENEMNNAPIRNELEVCKENFRLVNEAHHKEILTYEAKLEEANEKKVKFEKELVNARREKESLIGRLESTNEAVTMVEESRKKCLLKLDKQEFKNKKVEGALSKARVEYGKKVEELAIVKEYSRMLENEVPRMEKLRLSKCGKSGLVLPYKQLNERQVVTKIQGHRLEYKHFRREFWKPFKQREVRMVNTLPRKRGFQPQDFLPILERIPRNCVYSPVLGNGLKERYKFGTESGRRYACGSYFNQREWS